MHGHARPLQRVSAGSQSNTGRARGLRRRSLSARCLDARGLWAAELWAAGLQAAGLRGAGTVEPGSLLLALVVAGQAVACQSSPPRAPAGAAEGQDAKAVEAAANAEVATLELSNPSAFRREKSPVYLSYRDLGIAQPPGASRLELRSGDTALPLEPIDRDGDGEKDGVFALLDFASEESRSFRITSTTAPASVPLPAMAQAEISVKQGGQWQPREKNPELKEYVGGTFRNVHAFTPPPEHTDHSNLIRYEGPGIESDKVGYRIYLDERNGFDIFGKKVPEPVLQNIGLDGFESYHHPAPWGMDILKVGASLGTGGFGFWNGKGVDLVSRVDGWDATIVEPGGIYSAFRIDYRNWQVGGQSTDVRAHFSMHGGSRLVHVRLHLGTPLPKLAIGIVKHPETALLVPSKDDTDMAYRYLGSWGPQSLAGDQLGMAVMFRRNALASQETTASDYVAVVEPSGSDLDYYFLAAWAGEPGGIQSREAFASYLDRESERLTMQLRQRLTTARSTAAKVFPTNSERALDWAERLADSELARKTLLYRHDGWDTNRGRKPKFEYDISGLLPMAYDELGKVAPDERYRSVPQQLTASFIGPRGQIETYDESAYSLDSVMPGEVVLRLYEQTQDERYKVAASQLRRQLEHHPRTTQGAFWHKKRYPSQVWLDGVYMGMPFLARYSRTFEAGRSLDDVVKEFTLTREHLRDPQTGLYFHAWDESKQQEWADPKTGRSRHFWGRGLGWFSMAVVDVLDHIPEHDREHREPLLQIVRELGPALIAARDEATGTWWQIMNMPGAPGNYRESSASAMFSYFLAKAVRKGYLPASERQHAVEAFDGVVREFIRVYPDGSVSLTNQCLVAGLGYGRDGSYRYYMSEPIWQDDPKATGPFILAAVELHRLLQD
jgi:unsaturated rhamnogalacturonyl hydrolase